MSVVCPRIHSLEESSLRTQSNQAISARKVHKRPVASDFDNETCRRLHACIVSQDTILQPNKRATARTKRHAVDGHPFQHGVGMF